VEAFLVHPNVIEKYERLLIQLEQQLHEPLYEEAKGDIENEDIIPLCDDTGKITHEPLAENLWK